MRDSPPIVDALRRLGLDGASGMPALALSAEDATWLSGYFSGLARALSARALAPDSAQATDRHAAVGVCVLYASETGNAASLARRLLARLQARGLSAELHDLASYKPRSLERESTIVIITSTHGDGDPPESARSFFEALVGPSAPKALPVLRFAVMGLGDSSYEHFCKAARVLDERLAALGATRLRDRVDCDVDFQEPAAEWMDELTAQLSAHERVEPAPAQVTCLPPILPALATLGSYDRARPFTAAVLENFVITGRGSSKETRHLALSLQGSGLRYLPGDALGVCAPNDPTLVAALLTALGLRGDEAVALSGERLSVREALRDRLDVTVASPRFLGAWAEASQAEPLLTLARDPASTAARAFLRAHHVLDLIEDYPARSVPADVFTQWLRPLTPRLYSVASSLSAAPDEVHLTVGVVRYELRGSGRTGVASGHLAERVNEGDTLQVYVHTNPTFRLPSDARTPILMIGAGTGIAPYRAFCQERATQSARGPSWLFFGERNFRTDFLYQTEWQAALLEGSLSRLTLAFSRDQSQKVYVQDRMREHARDLHAFLEDGAHVYVCGDAQAFAPAVHEALLLVLQQYAGSRERALERLQTMREQGRYQRDVY